MEWIDVKERLPENGNNVLVFNTAGATLLYGYSPDLGWISSDLMTEQEFNQMWTRKRFAPIYVTHWMPLPEPPKDEGGPAR